MDGFDVAYRYTKKLEHPPRRRPEVIEHILVPNDVDVGAAGTQSKGICHVFEITAIRPVLRRERAVGHVDRKQGRQLFLRQGFDAVDLKLEELPELGIHVLGRKIQIGKKDIERMAIDIYDLIGL